MAKCRGCDGQGQVARVVKGRVEWMKDDLEHNHVQWETCPTCGGSGRDDRQDGYQGRKWWRDRG